MVTTVALGYSCQKFMQLAVLFFPPFSDCMCKQVARFKERELSLVKLEERSHYQKELSRMREQVLFQYCMHRCTFLQFLFILSFCFMTDFVYHFQHVTVPLLLNLTIKCLRLVFKNFAFSTSLSALLMNTVSSEHTQREQMQYSLKQYYTQVPRAKV